MADKMAAFSVIGYCRPESSASLLRMMDSFVVAVGGAGGADH
jgi:hypothetical protein